MEIIMRCIVVPMSSVNRSAKGPLGTNETPL